MGRITFNTAVKCDKAGRKQNQDNFYICPNLTTSDGDKHWVNTDAEIELSQKGALFVVADGMGGMNAGEKASEFVVKSIQERFSNIPENILSSDNTILTFITDSIRFADEKMKTYAKTHSEAEGLGSTIVLLWLFNGKAYCGWCGDSRIYRYNANNKLAKLSHDHSYVQSLVDEGKITEDEAFDHPDSNIVTRSLGDNGEKANPETKVYDIFERDVFLLCSDGLCGLLQDNEIEDIIAIHNSSTKDALDALWLAGEKKGWSDNATIELVSIDKCDKRAKGIAQEYPKVISSKNVKKKVEAIEQKKKIIVDQQTSWFRKKPIIIVVIAFLIGVGVLFYLFNNNKDKHETTNEYYVPNTNQEQPYSDTNQEQSQLENQQNQTSQHSPENSAQPQQSHQSQQQQSQSQNQQNQAPQHSHESSAQSQQNPQQSIVDKVPSGDYLTLLNKTRKDYENINEIWENVEKTRRYNSVEKEKFQSFITNVNTLSNQNNADYTKIDSNLKEEIAKWKKLADKINSIINQRYNESTTEPMQPEDSNPETESNSTRDNFESSIQPM